MIYYPNCKNMNMILYVAIIALLIACNPIKQKDSSDKKPDIYFGPSDVDKHPRISVAISLKNNPVPANDPILIDITLTNKTSKSQKILFDKPERPGYGPFGTTGKVLNKKTGKSVLKYENKGILESTLYDIKELDDKYEVVQPGKSLSKTYKLTDIVVFNTPGYQLPKGIYTVQLNCLGNNSNKVNLVVQ